MHDHEPEIIIGVCGPKRSGKDTLGDLLCEKYGFTRIAFGDPVKEGAKALFDLSDEQLYGEEKEDLDVRYGVSARHIMQQLGTNFCRNDYGPNIFVDIIKNRIINKKLKRVVVTDIRFPNEAAMVQKFRNGKVVKVFRPGLELDQHVSEQLFDTIKEDYIVENDSTKDMYFEKIDGLMTLF